VVEKVYAMSCNFTGENGHDTDSDKGKQGKEHNFVATLPNLASVIHDSQGDGNNG
jgi:hypothetical protein